MSTTHFNQRQQHQGDRSPQQRWAGAMSTDATTRRTELAKRSSAGIDVTLYWVPDGDVDGALVCVCDRREGAYFEIPTEPYLALDVYYHPFAYRDFSAVDYEDDRLAA